MRCSTPRHLANHVPPTSLDGGLDQQYMPRTSLYNKKTPIMWDQRGNFSKAARTFNIQSMKQEQKSQKFVFILFLG